MRQGRRVEDPYAGRIWLDWAYSMGRLAQLGDLEACGLFAKVLELSKAGRAMRHALLTQFRMGERHEREVA